MQFKKTAIALAVSSFCLSGGAFANEIPAPKSAPEVAFTKKVNVEQNMKINGRIHVNGYINVRNSALAITDTDQSSTYNVTDYYEVRNSSDVSGHSLENAKGNINLNVGSGDNNVQANSMAIAKTGGYLKGGTADAETFLFQDAAYNDTFQSWARNNASMGDSALEGASGNIGVNIAAGTSNLQANSTALAVADDSLLATATAGTWQSTYGNFTWSGNVRNSASLSGDALKGAKGNIGVNIAAGNNNAQSNSLALSRSTAPSYK